LPEGVKYYEEGPELNSPSEKSPAGVEPLPPPEPMDIPSDRFYDDVGASRSG